MMVNSPRRGRLEPHESQLIDRTRIVAFDYEGWPIKANEGDTIASALYGAGIKTLSRSFKYHRPRGLLCVAGRCANCLMTVDGVPNVRTCTEPVRTGMRVRHQNAWPTLNEDFLSVLDFFDRLLPVGFYYKTFHRPKLLWSLASRVIRHIAGLGSVETNPLAESRYHHENRHADVAVVGGGPAGMSAALAAAGRAERVVLIDDQPYLGGHLRFDVSTYRDVPDFPESAGYEMAAGLTEAVRSAERIEVLSQATAFGLYEGNLLGVLSGRRVIKLRARQIVIATGSYEVPLTFDRNDLPGIILSTGAQRLIHLHGIKPGRTAIVATCNDHGYYAARDLLEAGVRVVALLDSRPDLPYRLNIATELQARGVQVLTSHALLRAEGWGKVKGGVVTRFENGQPTRRREAVRLRHHLHERRLSASQLLAPPGRLHVQLRRGPGRDYTPEVASHGLCRWRGYRHPRPACVHAPGAPGGC